METTINPKTDSQKKECSSYVEALKRIELSPLKALGFGQVDFTARKN